MAAKSAYCPTGQPHLPVLLPLLVALIGVADLDALQLLALTIALRRLGHGLFKYANGAPADEEPHHPLTVESSVVARGTVVGVEAIVEPTEQMPGLIVAFPLVDPVVLGDVLGEVADLARLLVHKPTCDFVHLKAIHVAIDVTERELQRLQVRVCERRVDAPQKRIASRKGRRHKFGRIGVHLVCRHKFRGVDIHLGLVHTTCQPPQTSIFLRAKKLNQAPAQASP